MDGWIEVDREGRAQVGEDEHGMWWGTRLLPIRLPPEEGERRGRSRVWHVEGWLGPERFDAWVRAPGKRRVRDYFEAWGMRDVVVEPVSVSGSRAPAHVRRRRSRPGPGAWAVV